MILNVLEARFCDTIDIIPAPDIVSCFKTSGNGLNDQYQTYTRYSVKDPVSRFLV